MASQPRRWRAECGRKHAAGHFGWLGAFLAIDSPASSLLTCELMGWQPACPGLLEDLGKGHYFHRGPVTRPADQPEACREAPVAGMRD